MIALYPLDSLRNVRGRFQTSRGAADWGLDGWRARNQLAAPYRLRTRGLHDGERKQLLSSLAITSMNYALRRHLRPWPNSG